MSSRFACSFPSRGVASARGSQDQKKNAGVSEISQRTSTSFNNFSRRAAAIALAIGVCWLAASHPTAPLFMLGLCTFIGLLVLKIEGAWLIGIPIAIVSGSWYPWTGDLLVEERDLFLCTLLAGALWNNRSAAVPKGTRLIWLPFVALAAIAFANGVLLLPTAAESDSLSLYTTRSNAIVSAKALAIAFAFVPFLINAAWTDRKTWVQLRLGMQISAVLVSLFVVAERLVSYGLFDFSNELRVSGPFASMHIGGMHIDAFWGLALPFVFQFRTQRRGTTIALWAVQMLSAYTIFVTMSRALIGYATVSIVTLAALRLLSRPECGAPIKRAGIMKKGWIAGFSVVIGTSLVLVGAGFLWSRGDAVRSRFDSTSADWRVRVNHWQGILGIVAEGDVWERWIGHGLGTYPLVYRDAMGLPGQPIALHNENGESAVQIFAGEKIYLEQWVPTELVPPLTLNARIESSPNPGCSVSVVLCHKLLLQSFESVGSKFEPVVSNEGLYAATLRATPMHIASDDARLPSRLRPVSLGFAVGGERGGWVKISEVSMVDAKGNSILRNGDFSNGSRYWYFTCDDHLVWRAKNTWVHLAVDMGWFGLGTFAFLVLTTLVRIVRTAWTQRDWPAAVLAWSLGGFLQMGLFGTLIDTPGILMLFLILLAFAQGYAKRRMLTDTTSL